jgi:hypothetical protein
MLNWVGFKGGNMDSQKQPNLSVLQEPEVVETVPLVPFKILETDIPFYSDSEGKNRIEEARIVILQALDPDDQILEQELVPSTLRYSRGDYVTMNFDSKKLWEESWYRNPVTREIEQVWSIHVNFVGHRISQSAVKGDQERIAELERRLDERLQASNSVQ